MPLELRKIAPVELRSLGLDEKWLQDQISDDPGILGLGELEIAGREHRQPVGGRIDFLLRDPEDETYYEVEVMLGELDASHIIRTIEYWDIERQRRPSFTHRAVIVAEHITSRFFNVLRLLNRAIPMIAVQLSAFPIDNDVVLHPVTVLDVSEETADVAAVDQVEQADRTYWEKKADPASLAIVGKIVAALKSDAIDPRLTYNRYHIAMGTKGYNFCWFQPRRTAGHCHIEFRATNETRDAIVTSLQEGGIDASPRRTENITFSITSKDLEEHFPIIKHVLKRAEETSRL